MSKNNIDLELIIAYIYDDIASLHKKEEVRYNIENDPQWFSAYLDLKESITEMESADLEMVPDELLNPSVEDTPEFVVEPPRTSAFDFAWLMRPQVAMGAACMLIIAVFIYLSPTEEPISKEFLSVQSNNVITIEIDDKTLNIYNMSTDELTVSINNKDFSLSGLNNLDVQLENGDNTVVVVNSEMNTIKDTTITVNE